MFTCMQQPQVNGMTTNCKKLNNHVYNAKNMGESNTLRLLQNAQKALKRT